MNRERKTDDNKNKTKKEMTRVGFEPTPTNVDQETAVTVGS
jgi:hypothetical protein